MTRALRLFVALTVVAVRIPLATSGCPLASLHVADDFTGDRKADVFDGRCGG